MTNDDAKYIGRVLAAGLIQTPCLELGVGYGGENNKRLISGAGIRYLGTDMMAGDDVDYVIDFEQSQDVVLQKLADVAPFGTVLILNVLEHTFNPLAVLDNAFSVLRAGGTCVVLTPTAWPLHNFPYDTWRINPNLYEEYSKRHGHELIEEFFEYVGRGRVRDHVSGSGDYQMPLPYTSHIWGTMGRVIHKLFNTHGRMMMYKAHIATAVVIRKR